MKVTVKAQIYKNTTAYHDVGMGYTHTLAVLHLQDSPATANIQK